MVTGSPKLNFIRKERVLAHDPTPHVLDCTRMETEENPRFHTEHHQDPPAWEERKEDDTSLEQHLVDEGKRDPHLIYSELVEDKDPRGGQGLHP